VNQTVEARVPILSGVRVIELSGNGIAGMAAKHFADWGAEITILEPPGGTPLRDAPPYFDASGVRKSALWAWLSRGKRTLRVGEAAPASATAARELCRSADVVLAEREMLASVLGLDAAGLRALTAGAATCVLATPFPTDGPYGAYKATDLGINALGGWMSVLGEPAREPLRPGGDIVTRIAGLFGFAAALFALRHERNGHEPQFVELSSQAVSASMIVAPWLVKAIIGMDYERRGNSWPMGAVECADGWACVPPLTPTHWDLLCQLMGIADVLDLPQGRDIMWRMQHEKELRARVQPWYSDRTRAQVMAEAQAFRIPASPIQTVADRLNCPQLDARGFFVPAEIEGRVVKTPRVAYRIEGEEPAVRGPVKELREAPPATQTRPPGAGNGSGGELPFSGLRVLDLTWFWSGPYAMMMLGALGADVIKFESVQRLDPYRFTLAPVGRERWWDSGPLWIDSNCDKRDVALDISAPEGKELFERLIGMADVVISNFSNRVMPNLGFTPERLHELNPRLVSITMPGYGPGGPWEDYVGYGVAFEQLVCAAMTGYPDGPPSQMGGFCDVVVAMHTVAAIELALQHRERTGEGTSVEVPQCETLDSMFAPEQIAVQFGAPAPGRESNRHATMAPHNVYQVDGKDRWISIAVASDEEFAALCRVLGLDHLAADARFATAVARKEHEADLDALIAPAAAGRDGEALERELQAAGVAACRVAKGFELPDDAGFRHQGFFQPLTREITGTLPQKQFPFRFSSIDASHKRPAPLLGQHTVEVLTELLALSADDLARLREGGVIGDIPLGLAG
jgi:crotonobetainyl-CoA:carnitine CoA-transferase CaiB-like acyl-CoA transferase